MFKNGARVVYIGKTQGWENRVGEEGTVIDAKISSEDTIKVKFKKERLPVWPYVKSLIPL